jgi:uncharacterized repeat protein (TIGR01451 family)
MDTTYQDNQMYKAYGLLYDLLKHNVQVNWAILQNKAYDAIDFTVSQVYSKAEDIGGTIINNASYKAGPLVIDSSYYSIALPIVQNWETKGVVVHRALTPFTAPISKTLKAAPTIGIFIDGSEIIAATYLNAAEIPDSTGQAWPTTQDPNGEYPGYPDMLSVTEIAGPTTTNHKDGILFDQSGIPVYCQLMSMHYDDAGHNSEVVAEVKEFLKYTTHFFAECQAVTTFENDVNGFWLTTLGLSKDADPKQNVYFFNSDDPFAQNTGYFKDSGGSVPSFKFATNSSYRIGVKRIVSGDQNNPGSKDVWVVGHLEGNPNYGKISYLGGHAYTVDLPYSTANGKHKGTRYFLNSLFEAPCTSDEGLPNFTVTMDGPSYTTNPIIVYTIDVTNIGPGFATNVSVNDILPPNTSFISASNGGVYNNGVVSWNLGNMTPTASISLQLTIELQQYGSYENSATVYYHSGLNQFSQQSNSVITNYQDALPGTVGDNKNHSGQPLFVNKVSANQLNLNWGSVCNASDYSIYRGTLPILSSSSYNHDQLICSTDGATSYLINSDADSYYFLVVANNNTVEGSYGEDSGNNPRPVGITQCKPQSIGNCN